MMRRMLLATLLGVSACSGGGGGGGGSKGQRGARRRVHRTCSELLAGSLSVARVQTIIAQAVAQVRPSAHRRRRSRWSIASGTCSGCSRCGRIRQLHHVATRGQYRFEGVAVDGTAAISKAGTAAYLSSQGNAFTTRTASQIIQQNFNPGVNDQPGGPLFGVQFSQLPCGDLVKRYGVNAAEGPKQMPLGFSGDPGGLPLYINGVPVGGVGVEFDGLYTIDPNVQNVDPSPEERAATAATRGFEAPTDRRADRIVVGGLSLRFADAESVVSVATPAFGALPGGLVAVENFSAATVIAGARFLTNDSGVARPSRAGGRIPVDMPGARATRRRTPPPRPRRRPHHERGDGPAARSVDHRVPGARGNPPASRIGRAREHLGGGSGRRGPRPRALSRRAGLRHRRLAPEGPQRGFLLAGHGGCEPRGGPSGDRPGCPGLLGTQPFSNTSRISRPSPPGR
jgi:ribosomal protein L32